MQTQPSGYRSLLREAYVEKKAANGRYSLRAFAKCLGLAPSSLTDILGGRINLSAARALKIAGKLQWSPERKDRFLLLVQMESTSDPDLRSVLLQGFRTRFPEEIAHDLSVDQFQIIADWHHFGILEFTYVDPTLSPMRATQALGIDKVTFELAKERLLRLGLLEKVSDGTYRKTRSRLRVSTPIRTEAVMRSFDQFFELAAKAIHAQPVSKRFTGIEFLPFDPQAIHEAKELTETYISQMIELSKKSNRRSAVFGLGVQFFNVKTQGEEK